LELLELLEEYAPGGVLTEGMVTADAPLENPPRF
jgi:hypothetical protein